MITAPIDPAGAIGFGAVSSSTLVNVVIFAIILVFVLYRQFIIRAVTTKGFILIAILFVYGLSGGFPTAPIGVAMFITSTVFSIGFGIWRGSSMRIWRGGDGVVLRQGTALTITLWAVTVATKLVLDGLEVAETHTFAVGTIWLGMAITLAVQHCVLLHRAQTLTGDLGGKRESSRRGGGVDSV